MATDPNLETYLDSGTFQTSSSNNFTKIIPLANMLAQTVARAVRFNKAISLSAWRAASFDAINLRIAMRAGFVAARSP